MTGLPDIALRVTAILLVALAAHRALGRRSAATRHAVLAVGIVAALAVGPAAWLLPAWTIAPVAGTDGSADTTDTSGGSPTIDLAGAASADDVPGALYRIGATAWAAGTVAGGLWMLVGLARLLRETSRATLIGDGRLRQLCDRIAAGYGIGRPILLLAGDASDTLATWGLVRPIILLPAAAATWSDARARVVLLHEIAHIRRADWAVQVAGELLRVGFWFNPAVWLTCRRLRRESEHACDDAVLGADVEARDYARHLVEIARECRPPRRVALSPMAMARPSTLEGRISAMLNPSLDRRAMTRRALVVLLVVGTSVTLPTAALRLGAQAGPLALHVQVYDPSGAVLPGVAITLEDAPKTRRDAVTDATGRVEFPDIPPGEYAIDARLAGFRTLNTPLTLGSARDWRRAITLQVGDLVETVNVAARRTPVDGAPASAVTEPLQIGGNIRAPRKLKDVRPAYPPSMRDLGLEGVVPIEALIGRDGAVASVRVVSAQVHPDFARAALEAVHQWQFSPTLLNGEAIEVRMTVSVRFSLSD